MARKDPRQQYEPTGMDKTVKDAFKAADRAGADVASSNGHR
ncbi:MAG: hypothetical protein WA005_12045 [Candidatus Binataceae bacterium]